MQRVRDAAWVIATAKDVAERRVREVAARPVVSTRPAATTGTFTASSGDYHSWPDWPLWRAVGLCEQRGSGQYDTHGDGIAWGGSPAGGFPGSAYPGGLGMSVDFWREFAPAAGVAANNGAYASPEEQIRVARVGSQNGTHMRGWSSWTNGCVARNGG